jgi:hypothetical protein
MGCETNRTMAAADNQEQHLTSTFDGVGRVPGATSKEHLAWERLDAEK